ncbi:hypothetical protein TWF730_001738 [Orbilia blumenaviensis]|uniref:Uncharacterized protein n=1 Tax=Orbilia blumenaviensis TaxID=1796055 RepID=A0AAV9UJH2_9PEZI
MAEETTSTVPELEARVQQMEFKLAAIAKSVHLNGLGILNNTARQFNSQARDPQDQLQPLHIVESDEPQSLRYRRPNGFPHTLIEAISLRWDAKRLAELLDFYGVRVLRPGNHISTVSETTGETEDDSAKYIDTNDEIQVGNHSKECFTYFISYIGLKRKVVENYLPSTERRQTE